MFKLPQNTVLEKRNHDSRLDLAHHSRHLCYKITYQMATANQERKKKNRRKTHPSVLQCDSSYQKTIWLIGTDVADVVI